MSKPQKENGYSPIANELLEAICVYANIGTRARIMFYVVRGTYGWSRKTIKTSWTQIAKHLGADRKDVTRQGQRLLSDGILYLDEAGHLGLQKDYECWNRGQLARANQPRANQPQNPGLISPKLGANQPQTSYAREKQALKQENKGGRVDNQAFQPEEFEQYPEQNPHPSRRPDWRSMSPAVRDRHRSAWRGHNEYLTVEANTERAMANRRAAGFTDAPAPRSGKPFTHRSDEA